jgi:hypothetical protein
MHVESHPQTSHSYDLVVVGGGLSGLCAALAAARRGTKVALVHERSLLGGNNSSEVRVVASGSTASNSWSAETGLIHELLLEDRANNHEQFFDQGMINVVHDLALLDRVRSEQNITLFLNTVVRGVESEAIGGDKSPKATANGLGRIDGGVRRINGLHAVQLGSEAEFLIKGKQYMDATGDGTIGFLAGADFRYGREARSEFDEPLAPLVSDDTTMGSTINMLARDIGRPVKYTPPSNVKVYRSLDDIGFKRTLYHVGKPVYGGYWWLEVGNPFHQIRDNPEIREELHRHVLGVWNYLKNYSEFNTRATNYVLDWIGMVPGKRESRRLMGDVLLTEHHCHVDQRWADGIGFAGWHIDLHIKGGILNKIDPGERENADRNYKHWIRIPIFTIPLRCFYSRNVENLWMVGRCLSTTHAALGPVRVMQTLAHLAQGVGSAAAYALQNNLTPREAANPEGPHIGKIRQALLREDVRIPGLRNTDVADLALKRPVQVSSHAKLDLGGVDEKRSYNLGAARREGVMTSEAISMVVPLTSDRLDAVEFYLRNELPKDQRLIVNLQRLERIWDRDDNQILATVEVVVPASSTGWVKADLKAAIVPGYPYRISIRGGESIVWFAAAEWAAGTTVQYLHVSPGGPEAKNAHRPGYSLEEVLIPSYRHWRQITTATALRIYPDQHPYDGGNITNGATSPECLPNLWVSDPVQPLPQHAEIDLGAGAKFNCVEITFDTHLGRRTEFQEAFFRSPECARDWKLLALTARGWVELHSETDNYRRKRRVRFADTTASTLKVVVEKTNGSREARIYEVRVYNE